MLDIKQAKAKLKISDKMRTIFFRINLETFFPLDVINFAFTLYSETGQ